MPRLSMRAVAPAALICLLSLFTASAHAQELPESILRLKPQRTLRLDATSLGRIEGRFLRTTGDSLILAVKDSTLAVPLSATKSLWERGRATKTGAIVGGAIGTATLTFFGVIAVAMDESETGSSDRGVVIGAALVGAAGGAVVGGLIGAAIPKWHHRYP